MGENNNLTELQCKNEALEEKFEKLEILIKDKFDFYDKAINDINSERKLQSFQYKQIMDSLRELNQSVIEIKSTPSKRWDIFITAIITGIVTFGIGYFAKIMS